MRCEYVNKYRLSDTEKLIRNIRGDDTFRRAKGDSETLAKLTEQDDSQCDKVPHMTKTRRNERRDRFDAKKMAELRTMGIAIDKRAEMILLL